MPEVKVLTTLGMFAVPVTAETTLGEIRQKVQELEAWAGWELPGVSSCSFGFQLSMIFITSGQTFYDFIRSPVCG